jgi:uncharacterized protein YabE (DUF348 family)
MKKSKPKPLFLAIGGIAFLTVIGIFIGQLYRTYAITIDGRSEQVKVLGFTVGQILRLANISIASGDKVEPPIDQWVLFNHPNIQVLRTSQIKIIDRGQVHTLETTQRKPVDLLAMAAISLAPGDEILVDGKVIDPQEDLPFAMDHVLQIKRAVQITLDENGVDRTIYSTAVTLGAALWQAGIKIGPDDTLAIEIPPGKDQNPGTASGSGEGGTIEEVLQTPLSQPISVNLVRAVPLTITVDGKVVTGLSSSPKVGKALSDLGISLEGMDYSIPAEDQPVPEDGVIHVVRVREDVVLEQKTTPFGKKYEPDPNTELDHQSVMVAGLPGIQVSRVRIRYEDGKEVSRTTDAAWQAQAPQDEVIGYGTKVVVRTEVVDGVEISYWRKISVYATSYSPCTQGYDFCTTGTASGIPLRKGIIAVTLDWYHVMAFQQVFIPGYGTGTIADTSGGIPGTPFMDLGYSESDFVPWYNWTTVYFLTPVPAYIPWILP